MEELLRSNDPVYLSFVRHVLAEEGIDYLVLDEHMSALEGSIGVLPRRILVAPMTMSPRPACDSVTPR